MVQDIESKCLVEYFCMLNLVSVKIFKTGLRLRDHPYSVHGPLLTIRKDTSLLDLSFLHVIYKFLHFVELL